MKINQLILKPILTEKSTDQVKENFYMFEVSRKANKYQLKQVLEKLYSVKIDQIRIVNRKGKTRKVGRKQTLKQLPVRKIIYVKLKEGKIDLFPKT